MSNNHGMRVDQDIQLGGSRVLAHDLVDGKYKARTGMLALDAAATEDVCQGVILGRVTAAGPELGLMKPWDSAAADGSEVAVGVYKGMPTPAVVRTLENTKIAYYVSGAFFAADLLELSGGLLVPFAGAATGMNSYVDNEIITFN